MSTLTTIIQQSFGSPSHDSQGEKKEKLSKWEKKKNSDCLQMIWYCT